MSVHWAAPILSSMPPLVNLAEVLLDCSSLSLSQFFGSQVTGPPLGILHISNSLPSTCLSPNPTRAEVLVRTVPTQPHRGRRAKEVTLTGLLPGREAVGILESHRGRPWVGEELGFLRRLKGAGKGGAEDGLQPSANSGTGRKEEEWGNAHQTG